MLDPLAVVLPLTTTPFEVRRTPAEIGQKYMSSDSPSTGEEGLSVLSVQIINYHHHGLLSCRAYLETLREQRP